MKKVLRADYSRLFKSRAFLLSIIGMIFIAGALMVMQATSMDYSVPLSRVIFLPLSMFGVVMAAFVSVFTGTDFSDGFIRNKLLTAEKRGSIVLSQIIVCSTACVIVYAVVTLLAAGVGCFFFENDVKPGVFAGYFLIGIAMSAAFGCLFSVITLICGSRTRAIVVCMGLGFVMLFICMRTNAMLVQPEYKDGVLNPKYVGGVRRIVYGVVHDLNPYGQASQLSSWEVWKPLRAALCDGALIAVLSALGCLVFRKKDVK